MVNFGLAWTVKGSKFRAQEIVVIDMQIHGKSK